jgi:hypothetical protein
MLNGRDEFIQTAATRGLLYTDYDIKTGASLDYRVGRHLAGAAEIVKQMGEFFPARALRVTWPTFAEVTTKGIGAFLHDPDRADARRVFTN